MEVNSNLFINNLCIIYLIFISGIGQSPLAAAQLAAQNPNLLAAARLAAPGIPPMTGYPGVVGMNSLLQNPLGSLSRSPVLPESNPEVESQPRSTPEQKYFLSQRQTSPIPSGHSEQNMEEVRIQNSSDEEK